MNINTLDLNLLLVLDALQRTHSVTLAGEQLCISQSGVSNALRRLRDAFCQACIACGHVVERAVRLDVTKADPFGSRDRIERTELPEHEVTRLAPPDRYLPSSEPRDVGKPRVRSA